MNIAILIGQFPPGVVGGAELQAEAWSKRLASHHRLTVITRQSRPEHGAHERRDGFDIVRLPTLGIPVLRAIQDIRGVESVVGRMIPSPDVILCFQTFISGLAGIRASRGRVPVVVWVRGENEYRLSRSLLSRWTSPHVWSRASGVLVQSERNGHELLTELGRVAPDRVDPIRAKLKVIPNGLDLPEPCSARGGRILSVGRLIPAKGMDTVIDAVAGMQGLLTIAGDGPERRALEARGRAHELDLRMPGAVDRHALNHLYREAACVVLASRHGEGLPNVLLEAMGWSRPVIATDVGAVSDLVRHEENGLMVPPGDPLALRAALTRLSHERGLADRLGAAARMTAERFAWERVLPALVEALARWARK